MAGLQPVPRLLVGQDVLQAQAAPRPAPHYGAEAHVGGAGDVWRVEGEKGAAVQHQAAGAALFQQVPKGRAVDAWHLHYDHSRTTRYERQV